MNLKTKAKIKAKQALRYFNPEVSLCPICKHRFKACAHTRLEALLVLKDAVLRNQEKHPEFNLYRSGHPS